MSSPAPSSSAPARYAPGLARYKRHLHHLKPARWYLIGGFLAGALYSLSSGLGLPVMIKTVLPIFFGKESDAPESVVKFAKSFFGEDYVDKLMLVACLGLPVIFVVRALAAILNRYWINQAGFRVLENLRLEVYDRLLSLPLAFFQRNKAGDLNARLMGDTDALKNVVVNTSSEVIKQPLTLISALGFLVYLSITERSALFALIAILSVPLCVVPIRIVAKKLAKRARELAAKGGELGSASIETLQAPLEIQAYNLQTRQRTAFEARIREIFRLSMKTVKYQAIVSPVIEVVSVCGFVAALYFGTKGGMDFATFSALALALYMAYEPVKKLGGIHATIKTAEASLDRLEYILDAADTVPQPAIPAPLPAGPLDIVLDHVEFAYPSRPGHPDGERGASALRDVSLQVAPGETVALVGASGAGKSTFISLLPRFYDPTAGALRIGGVDLRQLDKKALRERIAIVPQLPALFNTTFAENIRLGRPGATDAEVEQAARRAHAHDFIVSQPQGYATLVGERGNSLSGGQRQRIAIARAFLKDAPVLILDEATSALDSESEAMIQQALNELIRGRTTFMIAHRFSSIRHATRILVFEHGRIVADGVHDSLYRLSPVYRDLYNHQMLEAQASA